MTAQPPPDLRPISATFYYEDLCVKGPANGMSNTTTFSRQFTCPTSCSPTPERLMKMFILQWNTNGVYEVDGELIPFNQLRKVTYQRY